MKDRSASDPVRGWGEDLFEQLVDRGVNIFAHVPDAGNSVAIALSESDPRVQSVKLTTEEEGVGVVAGAHLGHKRAVLLMQSSGVGNCPNALALISAGKFPFLTIVSMRGDFGEANPWQYPMGQATRPVLEAMGVICLDVSSVEEVVPTIDAAVTMAFDAGQQVAVLLGQRLIGSKRIEGVSCA